MGNVIALKQFKISIGIYEIAAFAIILIAPALRVLLAAQGWPMTNSDESTMGLMALHIAYHGELPIFFYGQGYMGTIQAYLAAALFHFFGSSFFTLRLGLIFLFALFLISMYFLTRLLYSKGLALFTLLLLSLGSTNMLYQQLFAIGGYLETLLFGSLILLLASWLALTSNFPTITPAHRSKHRLLLYGIFGLLVGIALWSDLLVLPVVMMATVLLIVFSRHELRWMAFILLLIGLFVGIFPVIFYNLTVPFQQSTLAYMRILLSSHGKTALLHQFKLGIIGTIMMGLPSATGGDLLCPVSKAYTGPISEQVGTPTIQCAVVHGVWGVGIIVLLILAILLAVHGYRQYRKALHSGEPASFKRNRKGQFIMPTADVSTLSEQTPQRMESHSETNLLHEKRQACICHFARLMVLGTVALILPVYALSYPAAAMPISSARYLTVILIAFPALIAPLWNAARPSAILAKGIQIVSMAILLFITLTFFVGTVNTFADISPVQASEYQQEALVDNLLRIGVRHIYSDYWTCDRLIFVSNEHIICSSLGNQLQPGYDRYPPYRSIVQADPHPSYVFPIGSPQAIAFAQKVTHSKQHYHHFVFDDYVAYQPSI